MYRRTDCVPNCCTCSVGEGPALRAIAGNDGDGVDGGGGGNDDDDDDNDEAIYEDCRLTTPGP
jgi:hypothetical protein